MITFILEMCLHLFCIAIVINSYLDLSYLWDYRSPPWCYHTHAKHLTMMSTDSIVLGDLKYTAKKCIIPNKILMSTCNIKCIIWVSELSCGICLLLLNCDNNSYWLLLFAECLLGTYFLAPVSFYMVFWTLWKNWACSTYIVGCLSRRDTTASLQLSKKIWFTI